MVPMLFEVCQDESIGGVLCVLPVLACQGKTGGIAGFGSCAEGSLRMQEARGTVPGQGG